MQNLPWNLKSGDHFEMWVSLPFSGCSPVEPTLKSEICAHFEICPSLPHLPVLPQETTLKSEICCHLEIWLSLQESSSLPQELVLKSKIWCGFEIWESLLDCAFLGKNVVLNSEICWPVEICKTRFLVPQADFLPREPPWLRFDCIVSLIDCGIYLAVFESVCFENSQSFSTFLIHVKYGNLEIWKSAPDFMLGTRSWNLEIWKSGNLKLKICRHRTSLKSAGAPKRARAWQSRV